MTGVAGGDALPAGKEVQSNPVEGEVGLIAFGIGETPLADGVLFLVSFDTANASNIDTLTIRGIQASAAGIDATALEVSVVDGAITLGCPGIGAPSGILATDDDPAGVSLSWVAVAGASEYQVYRSPTDVEADAVALGAWAPDTAYFDDTVPVSSGGGFACTVGADNVFYYWVAARSSVECESGLGGPVAGSRAAKHLLAGYAAGAHGRRWRRLTPTASAPLLAADALLFSMVWVILAVSRRRNRNNLCSPFGSMTRLVE